jgi:cobyrinic acid a,c-diamide synthase
MAALRARGLAVSPHKVGPDYIDPTYHALAAGRPGRNLDPFLCGEDRVAALFRHGARGADVAVVEGVLGLFDGRGSGGEASTAHVARLLRAPVVLVVDAAGAGRSLAALVHGFATFEPDIRLAGVILNRVGSDRHAAVAREAIAATGVPVLGVLRRQDDVTTPSRHLGLVPAPERAGAAGAAVSALGRLVADGVDLDAVLAVALAAPPLPGPAWNAAEELAGHTAALPVPDRAGGGRRPRIALAGGPAFTFAYAEHAELLTAAGAEVVPLDPLTDERLPPDSDGLVVGGGFPEEHTARLAGNAGLRTAVKALAGRGAPVLAECAGLLYLARTLDGVPMCGVLPVDARMTGRLTLGYREAVAATPSPLAAAGTPVRGHEFHRTAVTPASPAPGGGPAWRLGDRTEGFVAGPAGCVHASYLHLHWAGSPAVASRFVAAARTAAASGHVVARS